ELTEYELLAEEWGGEVIMVPVSAMTMEGLDKLLEMILLVSEVLELKANPDRLAKGTIIEAKLDKGRGPVATVLVNNGTLKVSDMIVAGTASGRIRAMVNDDGEAVEEAGPSIPVEVIGFSEVPAAGDTLHAVEQDKLSRKVVEERKDRQKAEKLKNMSKVSLDDLFDKIAEGNLKNLNIVVKADVQGSAEAIKQALEKISNDEVKVVVKHAGVGAIAEADVMLASVANAIIIGFNVRPDNMARTAADREKVDVRLYRVIYDAIEDVEKAMVGMLEPEFKEEILGHVEVRELFKVSSVGTIAGCYVLDGKINRSAQLRLLRDNIVIHEGAVGTLRRFKDDVKEVSTGYECGISIENYNNIEVGDIIEAFEMKKVER
ncbi:MAG: translation initiation factor IF-2, partial [Eubacteriales bacterium]